MTSATETKTTSQTVGMPASPAPAKPAELSGEHLIAAAERGKRYSELGPVYGGVNVVGDLGFEVGFQTGEGTQTQRSGLGFYLRSDHMAKRYLHDQAELAPVINRLAAILDS